MNKKLKSLILSGVLVGSMVSAPTFATENEEQEPTLITEIAEVSKEESLSKEEVHSYHQPSDDEIPEIDDYETTQPDETVAPDAIEPVEKVEDRKEMVADPAEDEEAKTEGELDDKEPSLYSTTVPTNDDNKNLEIGDKKLFKNAYRGQFWVNGNYNGDTTKGYWLNGEYWNDKTDGIIQRRYVDHIDIRVADATVNVTHSVNGVVQSTETIKNASVTDVQRILLNGKESGYSLTEKRQEDNPQFGKAGLEFNFQIAALNTFNYETEWLDLTKVNKITFICTLEGTNSKGEKQTFENVTITINGIDNIVGKSYCSNASGLDYYVSGDVSDDIIIEIPPIEPPFVPEELDITLTPETGDISVYGKLYYLVFALATLVAINKKIIKIKGE